MFTKDWYKTHQHPRGMLGKTHSGEYKKEMSFLRKGRKLSKEWAENISKGKAGVKNPKTSISLKKYWKEVKHKRRSDSVKKLWEKGVYNKRGDEWKNKISETRKKSGSAKGDKNPNWRGGLKPLFQTIRDSDKYKEWWWDVFGRDAYRCVKCGKDRGPFNIKHKKPFSIIMRENKITTLDQAFECEELWNIDNGETLCEPCHRLTDTYGWKVWNGYLKGGKN